MKSISILGCGWLGKALAIDLIKNGHHVLGSTTTEDKIRELQSEGIEAYNLNFTPKAEGNDIQTFFSSEILIVTIPPKRKSGQTALYLQQIQSIRDEASRGGVKHVIF